ncbi:hypothetical protein APASM_6887 [Actinosynnema pretiosum subsp. pretiosum]|nr:hypothetical protein APASM_6887 [Actinosynnema pretiosum subsp. pretiosum]
MPKPDRSAEGGWSASSRSRVPPHAPGKPRTGHDHRTMAAWGSPGGSRGRCRTGATTP